MIGEFITTLVQKLDSEVCELLPNVIPEKYLQSLYDHKVVSEPAEASEKQQLLTDEEVPVPVRKRGILSGYRPLSCSVSECAQSVFCRNNETLNFWTHLLPGCYFLWYSFELGQELNLWSDTYNWPYISYIFTVTLCFFTSSLAHMFSYYSVRIHDIVFMLDYSAILTAIYGKAIAYRAYCFPENFLATGYANYTVMMCFVLHMLSIIVLYFSRLFPSSPFLHSCKLIIYMVIHLPFEVPLVYRLLTYSEGEAVPSVSSFVMYYILSFSVSIVYNCHLPEKFAPGKFDFIGNSHQLMHILTAGSAFYQVNGITMDLKSRKNEIVKNNWNQNPLWSIISPLILVAFDIMFLWTFDRLVLQRKTRLTTISKKEISESDNLRNDGQDGNSDLEYLEEKPKNT